MRISKYQSFSASSFQLVYKTGLSLPFYQLPCALQCCGLPFFAHFRRVGGNFSHVLRVHRTLSSRHASRLETTLDPMLGAPLLQGIDWGMQSRGVVGDAGVVASRQHPCADRGLLKKELELSPVQQTPSVSFSTAGASSNPSLTCGLISTLDVFAQSRVTNYAKRISSAPLVKHSSSVALAKPLYNIKKLIRMDIKIPVELLYSGNLERSQITATGFAVLEKDSLIAACMHAERCIDALSIPLFSADGRQRKRVEELRREGRWAPMLHDPPHEFSTERLPPPICFVSPHLLGSNEREGAMPNPGGSSGGDTTSHANGQGAASATGSPHAGALPSKKHAGGPVRFMRLAGEKPFQHWNISNMHGHGQEYSRPLRRFRSKDFSRRFGCDPFLNSFNEMQNLYQTISQHQQSPSEAEEDDDDVPVAIEAYEVEILQPCASAKKSSGKLDGDKEENDTTFSCSFSDRQQTAHSEQNTAGNYAGRVGGCGQTSSSSPMGLPQASSSFPYAVRPSPGSMNFIGRASTDNSPNRSYYIPSHFQCVDETEGGQFKLVDASVDKWLPERKNPIAVCIRDATVHERLKEHWELSQQNSLPGTVSSFEDSVEVTVAEQETNVQQNGRWRTVLMKWYTVSVAVPGLPPSGLMEMGEEGATTMTSPSISSQEKNPSAKLLAIGKASTLEAAKDLCAMHMEELLNFFGVPLSADPETQLNHFDGCLRWGRFAAPEPIPFAKGLADPHLPLPNKEWYVPRKARLRVSPMTVTEKLQALNRRVVSQYRQHHIEVDLMHHRQYDAVMAASPACLREFMRSQQHPFECAIMNFHLAPNEYRASVYLPLPAEYGVRGGCAVGRTEEIAYHLCALNAMDVLFALDCVPITLLERAAWQDYLKEREKLGMILPLSYRTMLYQSSPSCGREDGGTSERCSVLLRPSPSLRSPPGVRDAPNSWSSEMPPPEEIWKVLMTNADDFDVAPDPAHLPALQGLEVVNLLRRMFSRFLRSASSANGRGSHTTTPPITPAGSSSGSSDSSRTPSKDRHAKQKMRSPPSSPAPAGPLKCLRHYCGYQHQNGIRRVRANSCWLELPLDKNVYGPRIAYGRCLTRNGAERAFFIHAFRILHALRVAPWEEYPEAELCNRLYGGDDVLMRKELDFWRLLVKHVLDPSPSVALEGEGSSSSTRVELRTGGKLKPHVPSAELVSSSRHESEANDSKPVAPITIPSPNPVMTPQLASLTLL